MKKAIKYLVIILLFISLFLSLQKFFSIKKFSTDSVMKNIDFLSSNSFKGRLPGTIENTAASEFVKSSFKKNNILPYKDKYFQSFSCYYPKKQNDKPYLRVLNNKDKVIKEYSYGKDFKEDMLNFKKNNFSFNKESDIVMKKDFIQIKDNKNYFVIFSSPEGKLNFRSSFVSDAPHSMYIMVTKGIFEELKHNVDLGYRINCFIPYTVEKTTLNNVVARIKGKDSSKAPIVLSAHFDHVGQDLDGTIYSGALDNSSGTCFMLEMSKYIKSLGKPNRDIIFVGFNAEEFGFLGSKAFLKDFNKILKGSTVLNFDMIGGSKSVPLCIMGSKKDTVNTPLIKNVSSICSNNKINFNYIFEDSSDHSPFRQKDIQAITFCDNDSSKIHTPKDKINFINRESIERCYNIASKEVVELAFSNNIFILYYKPIIFVSLTGLILIILIPKIYKKKES